MSHCAVFLDRDGTINAEVNYLSDVSQLRLLDGVAAAIADIRRAGFKVIVVTNQAAVARGYLSEEELGRIHEVLLAELRSGDAIVDAIYYCPHHPSEGQSVYRQECQCRKPNPGMLLQAAHDWDIDLRRSYMVGDKISDLQAGERAGCTPVLVRTGYGQEEERRLSVQSLRPGHIADDLLAASEWILHCHLRSREPVICSR